MNFKKIISTTIAIGMLFQGTVLANVNLKINIPTLTVTLSDGHKIIKQYPIAAGKPSTPTITGFYSLIQKQVNPIWTDPATGRSIPGGPGNPLGVRWMRIVGNYGLHGNADSYSIGTYASHGCMRMYNFDVAEVYDAVKLGTPVAITYNTIDAYKSALVVHPDIYRWGANKVSTLVSKAQKLGIKLSYKKLNAIKNNLNKKDVVFSNTWSLFINKDFVTNDICATTKYKIVKVKKTIKVKVPDNNKTVIESVYNTEPKYITVNKVIEENKKIPYTVQSINLNDIKSYFNIICKSSTQNKISIDGKFYDTILNNKKTYISLEDFKKIIGSSLSCDSALEIYNMNIAYGKYQGNYLGTCVKIINFIPYVKVNDITDRLKIKKQLKSTKNGVYLKGIKLVGVWSGGSFYASAESFARAIDKRADYWSLKKYVNFR